ncbi:MAG: hypothetical protein AB1656_12550 [Candidatus Omnitrophota bacterium]
MSEWWNSLQAELQFFYAIGILSTLILLLQTILMLIGADAHGAADATSFHDAVNLSPDAGVDHPTGYGVLSVRTVVAFFTGFGWTGVIGLKHGYSLERSLLIATFVGVCFMLAVFYVMKALYGLRESGNINYRNAIGIIGSVYSPIPPNMSGPGQIEIMVQGRVRFVPAFTTAPEKLKGNVRVKVVDVIDPATVLVEPLDSPAKKE